MNPRSLKAIATVSPKLQDLVRNACNALSLKGMEVLVVSGLRTQQEQNTLFAQGRTAPGHRVTNARAGQSMHNYGLAVDVVPFLTVNGTTLNWNAGTEQFKIMVAEFKTAGLEWGGDWKGDLGDFDHFQLPQLPASPTPAMQADYTRYVVQSANLAAIWSKANNGLYALYAPKPAQAAATVETV